MLKVLSSSSSHTARHYAISFFSYPRLVTAEAKALLREIVVASEDPQSGHYEILFGAVRAGMLTPSELSELRRMAMNALENCRDTEAIPVFVEALKDKDSRLRARAARGLIQMGPKAKVAIPALREALHDQDEAVRSEAAKALEKIERGGSTPAPLNSEPKSFTMTLPDGRQMKVSPDMTRFKHAPDVDMDTIRGACEHAAKDARQNGIPLRDRRIRILVGVKSAYFDEKKKKWVRYKHEPEPVFDVLKIGQLGTVEFEPPY